MIFNIDDPKRKDIKNTIKQISNNEFYMQYGFPYEDNMSTSSYRKCWLATIFIDIKGYTDFCSDHKDNEGIVAKSLNTFHRGILEILDEYNIKNIEIQGDGIFGVIECDQKNCINANNIFNASLDINGYLLKLWKKFFNLDFKISIALEEELILLVGKKNNKRLVYAGGSVNRAKKQMEQSNSINCIILDEIFVRNNDKYCLTMKKTIISIL